MWDKKRESSSKQQKLCPLFSTVQAWCSDGQLLFLLLLSLALGQSGCSWSGSQTGMVLWHLEELGIYAHEVQVITFCVVSVA